MSDFLNAKIPYEPMKKNRWLIIFSEPFSVIKPWWINKASRPSYNLKNKAWDDMIISLYQSVDIGLSGSRIILDAIKDKSDSDTIINFSLEMLDSTGAVIEKWKISGVLKKVDFGELSMNSDELCKTKLFINPTHVELIF